MPSKHLLPGKNATSFSKDYQPKGKRGPKPAKAIRRLITAFGRTKAPIDELTEKEVKHFMLVNGLDGTYNEVIIARLYHLASKTNDIYELVKAVELISKIGGEKEMSQASGLTINFITPAAITENRTIDLANDSFTVVEPVPED